MCVASLFGLDSRGRLRVRAKCARGDTTMHKGQTISQPARNPQNRPDSLDVANALRACHDDFGGIARLQFVARSDEPGGSILRIEATWSMAWDDEAADPEIGIQQVYSAPHDGSLDAAALAVVSRLYDRLTSRMQAEGQIGRLYNLEAIINRYWLA